MCRVKVKGCVLIHDRLATGVPSLSRVILSCESATVRNNRFLNDIHLVLQASPNQFLDSGCSTDGSCLLSKLVTEPAAMLLVTARLIGLNPFGSH